MGAGLEETEKEGLPLSPVSSRFFFLVRAFSIPRARLCRSLEQAKNVDDLNQTCLGGL